MYFMSFMSSQVMAQNDVYSDNICFQIQLKPFRFQLWTVCVKSEQTFQRSINIFEIHSVMNQSIDYLLKMSVHRLTSTGYPSICEYNCRSDNSSVFVIQNQQNRNPNNLNHFISNIGKNRSLQSEVDVQNSYSRDNSKSNRNSQSDSSRINKKYQIKTSPLKTQQHRHLIIQRNTFKHQTINKSLQTYNIPQKMIWEFDMALNDKISQRIQQSINSQSKVIANYEIYLKEIQYKAFRQWKYLTQTAKIQQNKIQVYGYIILEKSMRKFYKKLKQYTSQKELQFLQKIKARSFNTRNKLNYLRLWRQLVYIQKQNIELLNQRFNTFRKKNIFKKLRSIHSMAKLNTSAIHFRSMGLVQKSYRHLVQLKQSKNLYKQLENISNLFRRKVLLSKGFGCLLVWRNCNQFSGQQGQIEKLLKKRFIFSLVQSGSIRVKLQKLEKVSNSKKKMQLIQKLVVSKKQFYRKQELQFNILRKRFGQFQSLCSLVFSEDVLKYSARQYCKHQLLVKVWRHLKILTRID